MNLGTGLRSNSKNPSMLIIVYNAGYFKVKGRADVGMGYVTMMIQPRFLSHHPLQTLTLDIEKECEYYMPYESGGKQLRSNSGRGAAR